MCICMHGVTLKIWLLELDARLGAGLKSRNSIQVHNYVCLDTSSLTHYVTSKD